MAQFDEREITRFRRMMPAEALQLPFGEIMRSLSKILGPQLYPAFDPSASIPSPLEEWRDTFFLKTANTVGINVRTIQHFWNVVPYSLVLPRAQNAIHILPIWEPGVVASLYGPASWNVNPEFFSPQLAAAFPHLDTVEKHLKVTVNILHLLGKAVGIDVVPHTDRYSEMALANPHLFEWLQRRDMEIAAHDAHLHRKVQTLLFEHLLQQGSAVQDVELPTSPEAFFEKTTENTRLRMLFGEKYDYWGRLFRRKAMVRLLHAHGYETVPATMGPPYRGLEVDPRPEAQVVDEEGLVWRDYRLVRPQKFSRVFGPLARYRLYESKDDNQNWELDFERPNHAAWAYCAEHYRSIVAEYGFDFMRGDMSHVQMRPGGVPTVRDEYYDLLGAVKRAVLRDRPYFGYFAESFLAPPNEMAYGDECAHLEAAMADSTLGDLQSEPVGTEQFVRTFWQYRQWLETRKFAPNFTIMTADKDDPRFDRFYLDGNEMRYFIALFLTDMPSYMGLGFECRDPHPQPAPNECYSKYYVFQMPNDPKTTNGPYRWGQNKRLYENLVRQKLLSDEIVDDIRDAQTAWLLPPDPNGHNRVIAWTQRDTPRYLFVANLDTQHAQSDIAFEAPSGYGWKMIFSTEQAQFAAGTEQSGSIRVDKLLPGEGVVFCRV